MESNAGAVLLALSLTIGSGGPAERACGQQVEQELASLGLGQDEVRSIAYLEVTKGGRSGRATVGYQAFVNLKSCRGELVIDMTPSCLVRQRYGRHECHLPGVPHD